MRVAVGIGLSLLYWIVALILLLFTQTGDPAPELQTPEGMSLVFASRQRTGLIVLVAEFLIYGALLVWIRGDSHPRSD